MGDHYLMNQYENAIQTVKNLNPSGTDAKRTIRILRNETDQEMLSNPEVRHELAKYLEYLYETEKETGEIPTEADLECTYNLSLTQRLKALIFGKATVQVDPLVNIGVGFGVDWQTEDIIKELQKKQQ